VESAVIFDLQAGEIEDKRLFKTIDAVPIDGAATRYCASFSEPIDVAGNVAIVARAHGPAFPGAMSDIVLSVPPVLGVDVGIF
jgi:hypothetical protein